MNEQEQSISKARERQRRRKEQQLNKQGIKTPSRRKNQIRPSSDGQSRLPHFDLSRLRPLLMGIGAIAFMLTLIFMVGLFKNNPAIADPNAIWLGTEWTHFPQDEERIKDLVAHLHEHKIGTVYAHVSELNFDNTWTGNPEGLNRFSEVQDNIKQLLEQLKSLDKNLVIYGAIRVQTDIDDDGYRLDEGVLQLNIAEFSETIINSLGFDGVMLQVAPVIDNDQNYLDLLQQVRRSIGGNALLAISVPPDWTPDADIPMSSRIKPGTIWSEQYKQRIGLKQVNQIIILAYNSAMTSTDEHTPADYSAWVAYQVQTYVEAIAALEVDTEIIIGISTSDNIAIERDTQIESIPAAATGIQQSRLNLGSQSSFVKGIAIFDWASTNDVEWIQFKDNWIDQ